MPVFIVSIETVESGFVRLPQTVFESIDAAHIAAWRYGLESGLTPIATTVFPAIRGRFSGHPFRAPEPAPVHNLGTFRPAWKPSRWTGENIAGLAIAAGLLAIGLSDTVAGMALRLVLPLPLYWLGLISAETVEAIALPYGA